MADYYQTLGVDRKASDEEIKKAYRKLAHKYHPYKPGGDEKKMKEINEAYQVLSDKQKRSQYDRFGQNFNNAGGQGFSGFNASGFGFDPSSFSGGMGDLGDIFEMFFGGMGGKQKRKTYHRGSDIQIIQEITLEETYKGVDKNVHYRIPLKCEKCNGIGHDVKAGFTQCSVCNGRGEIKETRQTFFGNFVQVVVCSKCFGTGQIPNKICEVCRGSGRIIGEKKILLEIRSGIQNDQIIKVALAGEAGERGAKAGDLYVRIKIKPHKIFERKGDDLVIRKEVNLVDILLGKKIEVPTISGSNLKIEVPADFDIKNDLKIAGEGMPHFGSFGKGSLIVELKIKTPKHLSSKAKKILEDLEKEL